MTLDAIRAALAAFALFYVPGALLARALGVTPRAVVERIPIAFVLSLAMIVPAAALCFALGADARTANGILLALAVVAALARLRAGDDGSPGEAPSTHCDGETRLLGLLVLALVIALTVGAVVWTSRGSVDRWWYLGYVRAWIDGPFRLAEPFLATGHAHPRFALNAWLAALAMWARLAAIDPVWLYERAAPALLVPVAFAAQMTFGRALFGSERGGLLTALCAGLLWAGGGPVAVLSRIPEDKVLASVVLTPVLWAAAVRLLSDGRRAFTWVLGGAALSLSTVHPVTFLFAAAGVAVYASWIALRSRDRLRHAARAALVLLVVSAYPLATGALARGEYLREGAGGLAADHPVARVHRARDRLIETRDFGYVVDPRLLAHPVAIVGLAALLLLPLRSGRERSFLAPTTLVGLAIAFVPPLAAATGAVVLPWMVHRVLWTLPLAALAAVATDEVARRLVAAKRPPRGETTWLAEKATTVVAMTLIVASAPLAARAMEARSRDERTAVALPDDPQLAAALAAVRALPSDAIVAAAPELSERLPALTGKHVLAMSDRATIAFAGSRTAAEARLRARAAIFGGTWKPWADVAKPTHVLFDPAAAAARYCAVTLLAEERFVLCTFGPSAPPPAKRMGEARGGDGTRRVDLVHELASDSAASSDVHWACARPPRRDAGSLVWPRPGPWSSAFTAAVCEVHSADGALRPRTLALQPLVGNAVEELTIQATGERDGELRWRLRTRVRVHDRELLSFSLPSEDVTLVRVELFPSFLPFLKLAGLDVTLDEPRPGGAATGDHTARPSP